MICQIAKKRHIMSGGLAQLARAPALHAGGQRFDSVILHKKKRKLLNTRDLIWKIDKLRVKYYFLLNVVKRRSFRLVIDNMSLITTVESIENWGPTLTDSPGSRFDYD